MSAEEHGKKRDFLFEEFEAATKERWLELVERDLKGADFDKKLVWDSYEGFKVQPMYFREENAELKHLGSMPGFPPYLRDARLTGNTETPWSIMQTHASSARNELRREVQTGLQGGETRVGLRFHEALRRGTAIEQMQDLPEGGAWITDLEELREFLEDLPSFEGLDIDAGLSSPILLAAALEAGCRNVHTAMDPVTQLVERGESDCSFDTACRLMRDSVQAAGASGKSHRVISVSGEAWHNAGASAVEEIACVLSTAVEYLHQMQERGMNATATASRMRFTFPVGSTFFMEVAKLRAVRALWSRVTEAFAIEDTESARMCMHVRSSRWTQTAYDPYVNMLRATVQAMAGATGGAESIDIAPFDEVAGTPGPFSRRIARNVQIILQEEAHLAQVGDPAAGSYYVEHLTDSIMQHAWTLFQEIEQQGGILSALENGSVQERIRKTAEKKRKNISRRKDVIVGTNQYPNLSEKPLPTPSTSPVSNEALQRAYKEKCDARGPRDVQLQKLGELLREDSGNSIDAMRTALNEGITVPEILELIVSASADTTQVTPLPPFRASEEFERLRGTVEHMERKPRVFLATYGPVAWSRARATFASGFFGAAGMDIIDNLGFESPVEAAEAALQQDADILVACSEDARYAESVPEILRIVQEKKPGMLVVVAGNPADDVAALTEAGVHAFVHVRSDVGETLANVLQTLGIEIS
ncbi:methylmalonyl-CoA mutase subunit beta [bacterium]|nr:methylmalonyl-CoA mutase subunit beta [bacterium]